MSASAPDSRLGARLGGDPMTWDALTAALAKAENAYAVARLISIAASELLGAERGALFIPDAAGDWQLLAATGFAPEPLAAYLVIAHDSDLPVARVGRDHCPLLIEDNLEYALRFRELAVQRALEGMQAEAIIALRADGQTYGIAVFDWHTRRAFTPFERQGLRALADRCGNALATCAHSLPLMPSVRGPQA
jgi:GAF domain-containing protein